MSCCGKKRNELSRADNRNRQGFQPFNEYQACTVRYTGDLPFSITGQVTGRVYHFGARNAEQRVDQRDAAQMGHVSALTRVG